ncbi:Protein arginine N-methyltransferase 5 [Trichinella pseudospiralis]|uniref:Protein arginine N-methyltransferase 5 n=1 Tax=Trichinella pseudospiralis TaxID=6337 RepID=A0A0V1IPT4_TRIPS|nr:Protein arginine N-methyltransferase 5 [Trichinella pseudospiralis]
MYMLLVQELDFLYYPTVRNLIETMSGKQNLNRFANLLKTEVSNRLGTNDSKVSTETNTADGRSITYFHVGLKVLMKYSTKAEDAYSLPGYLLQLENKNIDFAVIAIENPRALHSTESTTNDNCPLFSIPDIIMKTRNWSRLVVGEFPTVKYESHEEDEIQCYIKARKRQLEYADYLGLSAMIVSFSHRTLAPLAHVLNHFFLGTSVLKSEFRRSCEADVAMVPRFCLFTLGTIASGQGPGFTCRLALIVVSEIQAVHIGNASVGHCHRREWFSRVDGRWLGDSHSQYGTRHRRVGCILSLKTKNDAGARLLGRCFSDGGLCVFRLVGCKIGIWCRLPLAWDRIDETADDAWHLFHQLRTACGNDQRLEVALEIGADLCENMKILDRWIGEPIGCLIITGEVFQTMPGSDSPTVSEMHRRLFSLLFTRTSRAVLEFDSKQLDTIPINDFSFCIRNLYKNQRVLPMEQNCSVMRSYRDYLQLPLQPLFEDLSAATYEVFETDSVKYVKYEMAIKEAISDKISGNEVPFFNVIVCGAGRGPLVTAVLKALEHFAIPAFQLTAVEKNINAVSTLDHLNQTKWNRKVHIVHSDVRKFKPPMKADIIVSEMLGSFGDNELSPECLYEAMKFLKPDGVCIPQFYQSYLSPVHAPKLHYNAAQYRKQVEYNDALECGYVVYPTTAFVIDNPQPLFPFTHKVGNNARPKQKNLYKVLKFRSEIDCELSGFLGYFYCILYKEHALSILPSNHTPNMRSWFSMFFPLLTPVMVKAGDEIEIHFWRNTGHGKVWYEWWLAKPAALPLQNPNGRSWSFSFLRIPVNVALFSSLIYLHEVNSFNKCSILKMRFHKLKQALELYRMRQQSFKWIGSKYCFQNFKIQPLSTSSQSQEKKSIAVTFLTSQGDQFKAYGKIGGTLLDLVFNENVPLDGFGVCEGACSCSTCHVILKREQYECLPSPCEDELDMLDLAYGLADTSRLACQIVLTEQLDGMEVLVPGVPDATQLH